MFGFTPAQGSSRSPYLRSHWLVWQVVKRMEYIHINTFKQLRGLHTKVDKPLLLWPLLSIRSAQATTLENNTRHLQVFQHVMRLIGTYYIISN